MKIETTTDNRKEIVKALTEMTGDAARYMGPPSFAYSIGDFIVNREGGVETENEVEGQKALQYLIDQGMARIETEPLHINVPIDELSDKNLTNLINLIHSKQYLINRAFGAEIFNIPEKLITILDDASKGRAKITDQTVEPDLLKELSFRTLFEKYGGECKGFSFSDNEIIFNYPFELDSRLVAYTSLVTFMVKQAADSNWISSKETIVDNEKYYMRVWLMRLGFNGIAGKEVRQTILENLKGNSAFRTQEGLEQAKQKAKEKKEREKGELV